MTDPALDGPARTLQGYMSRLCRSAYDRDWVDHLEYSLWYALVQGPMRFGRIELGDAELAELRRLSRACGGWIQTDRDGAVRWVPVEAWQDRYSANVDLIRLD
ncbi:MAG: hypothetical protein V2I63_06550 [Pseudomonadales bacterium]|jgi:hypothetical protein|nr:hypothetical protein [Pseudomonadales bacterium]